MNSNVRALTIAVCALLCTGAGHAQVSFSEDFDDTGANHHQLGPPNLIADGWVFRVQDHGSPSATWNQGPSNHDYGGGATMLDFPQHEGSGFLGLVFRQDGWTTSHVARWMILPDIPDIAGKDISFWLSSGPHGIWNTIELRYSPSGGIDTGTTWSEVGDFTQLLMEETYGPETWQIRGATIPGNGRLALRLYDYASSPHTDVIGIDDLQISATSNLPPLPGYNETVHWTAAMSPIVIDDEWTIISTGTVVIEPGVDVIFQNSAAVLRVRGNLRAEGTAAEPVRFTAVGSGATRIVTGYINLDDPGPLPHATCDWSHVICRVGVRVFEGGAFAARNSTFGPLSHPTLHAIEATCSTLALRDCTVTDHAIKMFAPQENNYLLLDGCTFDNAPVIHSRDVVSSTTFIDNCTFRNVTEPITYWVEGSPFIISGGNDVFFGSNNTIENNLYPVRIHEGGGIAPGSTIPTQGNQNNFVDVLVMGAWSSRASAGALAVPYRMRNGGGGFIDVEPGARFEMTPSSQIDPANGRWLGTPDAPILVEPAPGEGGDWGIYTYATGPLRIANVHLRGSDHAVRGDEARGHVLDCIIEDCDFGVGGGVANSAYVERSMFLNNNIALYTVGGFLSGGMHANFEHNPNWIEGNTTGAFVFEHDSFFDARFNWWGHPTGPQHPQNPGGQGDPIDPDIEDFIPFRTEPFDFEDHPPVVRFEPVSIYAQVGDRIILNWTAEDEGSIVSQRLEFRDYEERPQPSILVPDLPASARSVEITVPDRIAHHWNGPMVWRIVAVDERGQEGWNEVDSTLVERAGTLDFGPHVVDGAVLRVGEQFDLSWTPHAAGEVHVLLDDIPRPKVQGRIGYSPSSPLSALFNDLPPASTDMARYAIYRENRWWIGEETFAIRPHEVAGDAPPQVTMSSPQSGGQYAGGTVVPIRWQGSDDESVRSYDIQGSYDGGFFWHFIARDLPASAAGYDWHLPTSEGIADARVRVIVRDLRFQASSDTARIEITPGQFGGGGFANLMDFDIAFGSLVAGVLNDLETSDDACLQARSQFGFSAAEPNIVDLLTGLESPMASPAALDVSIESRINNPGGSAKVRIKNFKSGAFEQIGAFDTSQQDTVHEIEGIDASGRVRASDNRIELSTRISVIATFSAAGFDAWFDRIAVSVAE